MDQYQLCLLIVVFSLHILFGDTYKITAYHEVSAYPLETRRSLFTEYKRDLHDISQRDSSYDCMSSLKDSPEKQSRGLLGGLLGGLGTGGSQGGGGSEEESGQESGSGGGSEEESGQESGSGGGVGGLLSGLLKPLLGGILGRKRRQIPNEEFKKTRFRRNEDQGNLLDVDTGVLNDNDKPLLKNDSRSNVNQNSIIPNDGDTEKNLEQRVGSRLTRQLGDAGSLVDANVSVLDSGKQPESNNAGDSSSVPATKEQTRLIRSTTEENKWTRGRGAFGDLQKQKLQMKEVIENYEQQLLGNTKRLCPDEEKSGECTRESLVNKDISNTDGMETEEKRFDYVVFKKLGDGNHLDITNTAQITREEMRSSEGSSTGEDTSRSMTIQKEIILEERTKGKKLEPEMDKKVGHVDDIDDFERNKKIGKSAELKEKVYTDSKDKVIKSSNIERNNEIHDIDGVKTGVKDSKKVGSKKMENEEEADYMNTSSENVKKKEGNQINTFHPGSKSSEIVQKQEMDYTDGIKPNSKSSEIVEVIDSHEGTESGEIVNKNKEKMEDNYLGSIETACKSSKNVESIDNDNHEESNSGYMIGENVENKGENYDDSIAKGGKSNEDDERKEEDHTDEVETGSKNNKNEGHKEIDSIETGGKSSKNVERIDNDNHKESESGDRISENLEHKDHNDSIETEGKNNENEERKENDHSDRVEPEEQKESDSHGELESGDRSIENKEEDHLDSIETGGKSGKNVEIKEIYNREETESEDIRSENLEKNEDHIDSIKSGGKSRENEESNEMEYTGGDESGSKNSEMDQQKEAESVGVINDNIKKETGQFNRVVTGDKSSNSVGSRDVDCIGSVDTVETSSDNLGSREVDHMDKGKPGNKSDKILIGKDVDDQEEIEYEAMYRENKGKGTMDNTEREDDNSSSDEKFKEMKSEEKTDYVELSDEDIQNKKNYTNNSHEGKYSGKSSDIEGSSELDNNDPGSLSSENVENNKLGAMSNIESADNSDGNEGNREMSSEEKTESVEGSDENEKHKITDDGSNTNEAGENGESIELSDTDLLERDGSSSENSEGEEIDMSESSSTTDQATDSSESDGALETSDSSDQISENKNYFEDSEESSNIINDKGRESSHSPLTLIQDLTQAKDSSSNEEHPDYDDYSYFEYDFDHEYPETTSDTAEEEKFDDSSNAVSELTSAENTRKGNRYRNYIPLPYSTNYNFANIYGSAMRRLYWPFRYSHPQMFFFKRQFAKVPFRRSVPPAQAKKLEMPLLNQYPSSIAQSDLFGSYAYAHSSPFLGGGEGLDGEEGTSEEETETSEEETETSEIG